MSAPLRSSTAKRSRPRRAARVIAITSIVSTCAIALAALAIHLAAPALLEDRVSSELAALGLPDARFRIGRVGPDALRLEEVVLGPDLRAEAVELELDLFARRIVALHVVGARCVLPLEGERLRESTAARLLARASEPRTEGAAAPIDRVRIERSRLELVHGGVTIPIALEGELDPGAERGELVAHAPQGPIAVRARAIDGALVVSARGEEGAELDVRVAPGEPDGGAHASISGALPLALADMLAPGLALVAAPRLDLEATEHGGVWSLERATLEAHVARARLGDELEAEDLRVRASATGELAPALDLDVDAELATSHARWSDARFAALAISPLLRVDRTSAGELRVRARRDFDARVGTFSLGTGDGEVRLLDVAMTLAPRPERALVRLDAEGVPHVALSARATAPRAQGAVRGRGVRARGEVDLVLGDAPRLRAPIHVEVAHLSQGESEISAGRVRSDVAMSLDAKGSPRASGRIRAVRTAWRDVPLGATRGTIAISSERLALAFDGRATGAAPFHVAASVGLEREGGRVDVSVPLSHVGAHDALHRALLAATDLRVLGRAGGEMHVGLGPRGVSSAELVLEGATVDDALGRGTARGVRGAIHLAGLDPAVSADSDRLTWSSLSLADAVQLRHGSARLRIEPSGSVTIADAETRVGGGVVRVAPFAVDPEHPDVLLDLAIDGVDVRRLAEVVSKGRVSGTGRLDGRIAVRVAMGEEPRVELGRGSLSSRGPGRIRIRELPSASAVPTNVEVLQDGEWIHQRVLAALADFEYSRLALELCDTEGQRTLRAHVAGRGARTPQELDLTLNVRGVQSAIDQTLRLWKRGNAFITREPT